MQSRTSPLCCPNGHSSPKVCSLPTCLKTSAICKNPSCQYSTSHKKCILSSDVDDLLDMLTAKSSKAKGVIEGVIGEGMVEMGKMLEVWREGGGGMGLGLGLEGKERRLYEILMGGKGEELRGDMVHEVIQKLCGEQEEEGKGKGAKVEEKAARIREIFNKMIEAQRRGFEEIQKILSDTEDVVFVLPSLSSPSPSPSPFKFLSTLTNSQFIKLSAAGNIATKLQKSQFPSSSSPAPSQLFALLSPSISESTNHKVTLKVKKLKQGIVCVGAIRRGVINKKFARVSGVEKYLLGCDGGVFTKEGRGKKEGMKWGEGDVLVMEYREGERKIVVGKKGGKEGEMEVVEIEGVGNEAKDLYYCVHFYKGEDEWEILGN